jgi:peptide/nickel transport system permease protein
VVWRAITRKPGRIVGILIILGFAFMAIFGPMFYPKQLPINPAELYAPPSWAHPLGTDFEGTSVLAEIITGSRYVLEAAALAALFTVGFGTIAGITSGYYLGTTDQVIMRVTDFILTIPGFPLLIVLSTIWSFGSPIAMGLVLGLTGWGGLARAVRSQTLSLRERGFIEAAKGLGLSNRHVISREILPNISPYIAMNLLLSVTGGIYAEVGLFFLGVIPFQSNNWGVMLNLAFGNGAMYTPQALLYMLSPMACILLVTFGIVLTLDALDEILNPRLREG